MHTVIENWLSMRPGLRIVSSCLLAVLLGLATVGVVVSLTDKPAPASLSHIAENTRLKMRLQRLPPRHDLEARLAALRNIPPPDAFHALDFCQRQGVSFISWRPAESGGGELIADASWDAVPVLFSSLSKYAFSVSHFSLAPAEESLRLTLGLEPINAS